MSDEPDEEIDGQPDEPQASEQPTVDAGSPRAVRKRQTKLQLQQRDADRFWQGVFQSEVGRREMWNLLATLHPFETTFACGPNGFPQPEATWFKAGEQGAGLRIYQTWLAKHPLEVMAMHKEHDPRFSKGDK
jgi:hypothetical protein